MTFDLPGTHQQVLTQRFAAEQRFHQFIALAFVLLLAAMLPGQAFAADGEMALNFPIIDKFFCGFITYTQSKLAPYVAVLVIVIGVVGHWLGATKVWGTILYVAIGLGIISMAGKMIVQAMGGTSALSSSCSAFAGA